ncbi:hypothetical protein TWF281_006704 [Arthrobotrys megalospora]
MRSTEAGRMAPETISDSESAGRTITYPRSKSPSIAAPEAPKPNLVPQPLAAKNEKKQPPKKRNILLRILGSVYEVDPVTTSRESKFARFWEKIHGRDLPHNTRGAAVINDEEAMRRPRGVRRRHIPRVRKPGTRPVRALTDDTGLKLWFVDQKGRTVDCCTPFFESFVGEFYPSTRVSRTYECGKIQSPFYESVWELSFSNATMTPIGVP